MERPPEMLKLYANRLSSIITAEGGAELTGLLRLSGLLAPEQMHNADRSGRDEINDVSGSQVNSDRVGIWERRSESGKSYFIRCTDMISEWSYWASVGRIDPKGAKRRIVLVGESVARGYLYDPLFTPAMVLEKILQLRLGESEVEVVDLARTNLGSEVDQLAKSASLLEPDAVIIFAGNNWRYNYDNTNDLNDIQELIGVLREEGLAGLKRFTEDKIVVGVRKRVNEIASFYRAKGIPLIWIIPEFNLGDWRDPEMNAPYLSKGVNREWLTCLKEARQALEIGDIDKTADLAGKMVELDGGTCVTGLYLLAECSKRLNNQDALRQYLEMARDVTTENLSIRILTPRPYSIVQETLRYEAMKYSNGQVDLPKIFKEYLGGELPDRRLFLDYCHLNSRGILVAMAAAAANLLKLLDGIDVPWPALSDERIAPEEKLEGEAAFLAAIHNAHWWQSHDLVQYYCLRAVEKSPKIVHVMTQFIDLQTRRTPLLMCRSAETIADIESPLIRNYLLRHNYQRLDRLLIDAIISTLAKAGIDVQEQLNRLRQDTHSVIDRDIDLLERYYCSSVSQPQELMWKLSINTTSNSNIYPDYYRAYNCESQFVFIGKADYPVLLYLTCRLPGTGESTGTIFIEINGNCFAEEIVGHKWVTREIMIDSEIVQDGLNFVTIHWPVPELLSETAVADAANSFIAGSFPELFPRFGEIYSFVASTRNISKL
jgi:hypothetical protein